MSQFNGNGEGNAFPWWFINLLKMWHLICYFSWFVHNLQHSRPEWIYASTRTSVSPTAFVRFLNQNTKFSAGIQHCAAEFFKTFFFILGHSPDSLEELGSIPEKCDLNFLRAPFFQLTSEVICTSCDGVSSTKSTETLLPLHITKVRRVPKRQETILPPKAIQSTLSSRIPP